MIFPKIVPSEKGSWDQIVKTMDQINKMIREDGRTFWKLDTWDGQRFNVNLMESANGLLYLTCVPYSDWIQIRKIRSLEVDEKARKTFGALEDSTARDAFVKSWTKEG